MAALTVKEIHAPQQLCPLIETGKSAQKTYFSNLDQKIWEAPNKTIPVALSSDNAILDVLVTVTGGDLLSGTKYTVDASYSRLKEGEAPVSQKLIIAPGEGVWQASHPSFWSGVRCTIKAPVDTEASTRNLPWMFKTTVTWTMRTETSQWQTTTDLEIYVLPPYIPKYMINSGIPLGLLRLETLLPKWMKTFDPLKNDWPIFVINALFRDDRLTYDIYSGASTYCSFGNSVSVGPETSCWIELWLSDMNGLTNSAGKLKKYPINCFDTAGLGQTIASLNSRSETAEFRMIHLSVFGYLNQTLLIGRHKGLVPNDLEDLCNNPLYNSPGANKAMLCANDAENRSSFARHYFLTLDTKRGEGPKVFDSCCGPQTGAESLPSYLTKAIDQEPKYYFPNKLSSGGNRPNGPGKLRDTYDGPGVVNLAAPSSFKRDTQPTTAPDTLFGRIQKVLGRNPFNLMVPFEGSPQGTKGIVATWTYAPSDTAETQVSIWRYSTKDDASRAYRRRRASLDVTKFTEKSAGNDLAFTDPNPGFHMFYVTISDTNNFLVIAEGSMLNKDIFTEIVDKIKKEVLNTVLPDNTTIDKIEPPITGIKLNSYFEIKVFPSKITQSWWRGYKAETANGNALFIESLVDKDENVTLRFLARRIGHDNVKVQLYGPNLDVASRDIGVLVTA